jgi:hypothetical protein
VPSVGVLGYYEAKDGITEKFESFVGLGAGVLGAPRTMGQGLSEKSRVTELIPDPTAEAVKVWPVRGHFTRL